MTHSLHRQGSPDNLKNDFCILCMPEIGYNHVHSNLKARRFLEIVKKYNPDNYGVITRGNKYTHNDSELIEALDMSPAIFCVVNTKEDLTSFLKELKEEDLGLCVVVNGVFETVQECCREAGLQPHTVNHSLGIWGRTDKLPSSKVLEIVTMCGHGQISASLVEHLVDQVRNEKISLREAAVTMAKPCVCGFFNTMRAEELICNMVEDEKE